LSFTSKLNRECGKFSTLLLALSLNVVPLFALGALALLVFLVEDLAAVVTLARFLGVVVGSVLAAVMEQAAGCKVDVDKLGVGVGDGGDGADGEQSTEEDLVEVHGEWFGFELSLLKGA
jgi:hypothetical protein